jgi:hypothetical protein
MVILDQYLIKLTGLMRNFLVKCGDHVQVRIKSTIKRASWLQITNPVTSS